MTSGFANESLRASAGSGKTFQLSNRYISLLLKGEPVDSILASTFTRKAAGEIKTRVLTRIAEGILQNDKLEELAHHTKFPELTTELLGDLFTTVTRSLHRMQITTLDGYFAQLVRAFALELGLSPSWLTLGSVQLDELVTSSISEMLSGYKTKAASDVFRMLTRGDAGRSVTALVHDATSEMHQIYLTAPDSAWEVPIDLRPVDDTELRDLLSRIDAVELPSHKSFVNQVEKDLDHLRSGDWDAFAKSGLLTKIAKGESKYHKKEIPADLTSLYGRLLENVQLVILNELANINTATHTLVSDFAREFADSKQDANGLSFDDVTRILQDLVKTQDPRELAFRCDSNIKHLLLDEFQDTSLSQWLVLEPLASRAAANPDASLFCVGDTKQAIYGWRGGRREIFDILEHQFSIVPHPSDESHRSSPVILNAVNRVFSNFLDNQTAQHHLSTYTQWCGEYTEHKSADRVAALPGYAELRQSEETELIGNALPQTISVAIETVKDLLGKIPSIKIGVIMRKNSSVAAALDAFRQEGIEATQGGGVPLIGHAIIQLFGSLLQLTDHPDNTIAAFHLASSPLAAPIRLTDWENSHNRAEVAFRFREEFQTIGYAASLEQLLVSITDHIDDVDYVAAEQLIQQAHLCERTSPTRTRDLLAHLTGTRVEFTSDSNIHILNVHQSKGLEYDAVILPELHINLIGPAPKYVFSRSGTEISQIIKYCDQKTRDLLPQHFQGIHDAYEAERITELMCMLYVAMTRAKHGLYMIIPPISNPENANKRYHSIIHHAICGEYHPTDAELLWSDGDLDWAEKVKSVDTSESKHLDLPDGLNVTITERKVSSFLSASQLEGGELTDISSLFAPPNTGGMAFGDLVHELFEQVDWMDDAPSIDPRLSQTELAHENIQAAVTLVERQLATPPPSPFYRSFYTSEYLSTNAQISAAIASAQNTSLDVQHESPILVRNGEVVSTGYIDRLVLIISDGKVLAADILDYKTDSIEGKDQLRQKADHYAPQLQQYMKAISRMYRLPPAMVTSRLIFLNTNQIVEIKPIEE